MMSSDHICDTLISPAARSLNMVAVITGEVFRRISASASRTLSRSSADEVLTSAMPSLSSTMDIAVWPSSMIAVWFL